MTTEETNGGAVVEQATPAVEQKTQNQEQAYVPKFTPKVDEKTGKALENQVIISVPFQGGFIKGVVLEENKDTVVIQNYNNPMPLAIPNNDKIYRMQPGQKFDLRELSVIQKDGLSIAQKIDSFLRKTPKYKEGGFGQFMKENRKDFANLLYGKLTSDLIKGETFVENEIKRENGETLKVQEMKVWEAKFGIKNGINGLKMDIQFKQPNLIMGIGKEHNFPNEQISQEQVDKMMNQGQSAPYTFKTKTGEDYKVFVKFDKDLNKFITTPYSEKVQELMQKKYQTYEQGQTQATPQQKQAAPQQAQTTATATKQAQNKEQKQKVEVEKPKKKIGRKM